MGGEGQRSECGNQVRLDLLVPATPRILPEVRRALGELALPASVLDDARLLVSELVTNSIRHAGLHSEDQIRIAGFTLAIEPIDTQRQAVPQRRAS